MSKLYLRVSSEWAKLFDPQKEDMFLRNITGIPIQFNFYTSERLPSSSFSHSFTLGGTIGQARIPKGMYCYARARLRVLSDGSFSEDEVLDENGDFIEPEGILVANDSRMSSAGEEVEILEEQLASLTVSVMGLSQKVSDLKISTIQHYYLNYLQLLRQFLRAEQRTHYHMSDLQSQILSNRLNIFGVNNELMQFRNSYATDSTEMKHGIFSLNQKVKDLSNSNSNVAETVQNLKKDHTDLQEQFLKNAQEDHYYLTYLQSQVLDLRLRLFNAEGLIQHLRNTCASLAISIGELPFQGNVSDHIHKLEVTINLLTDQTFVLLNKVEKLEERLNSGDFNPGEGGSIPSEDFENLKKEVASLHTDFTTLNNGFVMLSKEYTVEDLDSAYADLSPTLPEEIRQPVEAIYIVLRNLIQLNERYSNTITKDDVLILEGSLDIAQNANSTV